MNYLVTGATSGIGKGVIMHLLADGHHVVGVGRDARKLEGQIAPELAANFHFLACDLRVCEGIELLVQEAVQRTGKLDGLVHCAGMEETLPLTMNTPERVLEIYALNVFPAYELLRAFSKKKCSNDGSSVVMLSSVMGTLGQPGKTGYCGSKAALLGITKSAALELAKRKIRVNAVLPGVVKTPMTEALFAQVGAESTEAITAMHPLGVGEVADITPLIVFLLGGGSRWITGQSFIADGGYSIQ